MIDAIMVWLSSATLTNQEIRSELVHIQNVGVTVAVLAIVVYLLSVSKSKWYIAGAVIMVIVAVGSKILRDGIPS